MVTWRTNLYLTVEGWDSGKGPLDLGLASFPDRCRLQFLIACSMQKWRWKAWEKESRVWRQVEVRVDVRVDIRGVVTDSCNSQTLHWSASSLLPNNELYWHCLSNVTVQISWTKYCKKDLKTLRQAPLPSCLPSRLPNVTHVTFFQAFPLRFCSILSKKFGL